MSRDTGVTSIVEVSTDKCDGPGCRLADALVYARFSEGRSLAFCAAHGTAYWVKLNEQAELVIDLRYRNPAYA